MTAHGSIGSAGMARATTGVDDLGETMSAQRARAERIAASVHDQCASPPRIDPAEWRGPAANAERAASARVLDAISAAGAAAEEARQALVAAQAAADA